MAAAIDFLSLYGEKSREKLKKFMDSYSKKIFYQNSE
jgi:hypothetical protein